MGARRFWVCLLGLGMLANHSLAQTSEATSNSSSDGERSSRDVSRRPNIVLVIVDDLGYGETGMMGNAQIPTPAIDALARAGVRCTAGYVTASLCSPSRAGLLTGRYQSRFGYDINPTGEKNFHPNAGLPESETTFVEHLSKVGYACGLFGKWHLGTSESRQPLRRGFQDFFGFLHEGHFYVPGPPYRDVLTMIRDKSLERGTRVLEGNIIRGNYASISEPAYDHRNPVFRHEDEIEEFGYLTDEITNAAIEFIDQHASEPFCAVVSYNAVHSPMQALTSDMAPFTLMKDEQRRLFAGMLVALDRGIGKLRSRLVDHGCLRQTLFVFLSDNGGPTEELTSSNGPLRGGKGSLYEGGLRVPFIFSMPETLPAGVAEDRPVLSLDATATLLEMANVDTPSLRLDGTSVAKWLGRPEVESTREQIYWRAPGGKLAFRSGNWKIVRTQASEAIELYHLPGDLAEKRNLAGEQPDVLKRLVNGWRSYDAQMPETLTLSPGS